LTPQTIAAPDGTRERSVAEELELRSRPQNIRVLALEDDDKLWRGRIRNILTAYDISCEAVKELSQFTAALQRSEYEVASIDWALEGTGEEGADLNGAEVLSLLQDDYPAIGKVVFSAYIGNEADKREARHCGADYVVEKQGMGSDEEYVQAVLDAARLNFFRHVLQHLRGLGRPTEGFAEGQSAELSDEQERKLYAEALDALTVSFLEGEEDEVLMNLLKRRGVLREFDSPRYISLPFHAKLAELLGYVRMTPERLAQILETDIGTAMQILNAEDEPPPLSEDEQRNAYWLASILDFVMRMGDDRPDIMPGFWTVKYLYKESTNRPPWDSDGLRDYLTDNGAQGLQHAVGWIRSY